MARRRWLGNSVFMVWLTTACAPGDSTATSGDEEPDDAAEALCPRPPPPAELPPLRARRCEGLDVGQTWDASQPGPFAVGVRTIAIRDPLRPERTLTTEVWYPAADTARGQTDLACALIETNAARDAPRAPADATAGLVVFSHGHRGIRCQSTFLTVHLASHGFVVVAPDHPGDTFLDPSASAEEAASDRVEDFNLVTTHMVERTGHDGDFFAGAFDAERIAWVGHSFGASTALMAGVVDNREIVNVALAPAFDERMSLVYEPPAYDVRDPVLIVGGTADAITPWSHQELAFARALAPKYLASIAGARHFDFTDLCDSPLAGIEDIASECGDDPVAARHAIQTVVTAMLGRHLRCDPAVALEPDALQRGALSSFTAEPGAPPAAPQEHDEPPCDVALGEPGPLQSVIVPGEAPIHLTEQASSIDAPPIVFVHGFSTTSAVFARQLEALSPAYRALAIDLPGHGASEAGAREDPFTLAHYADALEIALAQLELRRPVLVGWSSGAQVAIEVALRQGDAIRGLVLVDGAPLTQPDLELHPTYNGGETLEFARQLRIGLQSSDQGRATWDPLIRLFVAANVEPELIEAIAADFLTIAPSTRQGQIAAPRADLVEAIDAIAVPTLLIHGEQDDALLLESAYFLAEHIPDAKLTIFQRSGHAPFLEEPERFNHTLVDFLDGLPR
jgi:pimeloyl-ACP methyl ester carboxylesterase